MMKYGPTIIASVCCGLAVSQSAQATEVPESLLVCSELKDPGERVRCYDQQIAAMKAGAASPAPAPAASAAAGAANPTTPGVATPGPASASAPSVSARSVAPPSASGAAVPASTPGTPAPAVAAPVAAAPARPQALTPSASPPVAAVTTQPPPAAAFGEDSMPDKLRPKQTESERTLLSRITAVQEVRRSVFLIWLANGQIWRVEGAQRAPVAAFFRAGYDARIEKGALGSYQMSTAATGSKNWVQVERIH